MHFPSSRYRFAGWRAPGKVTETLKLFGLPLATSEEFLHGHALANAFAVKVLQLGYLALAKSPVDAPARRDRAYALIQQLAILFLDGVYVVTPGSARPHTQRLHHAGYLRLVALSRCKSQIRATSMSYELAVNR